MEWKKMRIAAAATAAAAGIVALTRSAPAAPLTAGNLVVYRVGDGSGSLVNTGSAVFLDEFTPTGTLVQSIPMPTTASGGNNQLIASGTATSEGLITRSDNGKYLLLTGYARDLGGTTNLTTTTATTVPRTIGRVDSSGAPSTSTAVTDFASSSSPRSVASVTGNDFWITGGAGGVRYISAVGATSSTDLTTGATPSFTNGRQVAVSGGQLYVSSSSGTTTFKGINAVGTGLPTTSPQSVVRLGGLTDTSNPSSYSFVLADLSAAVAGPDTLYVSDDSAGLQKFSLVSGSWTSNGTIGTGADSYRGLTATVVGTEVDLFATRKGGSGATGGGELVSLVDTSGYNGAFSGAPTTLAIAATNTAFRGVALAPVPEPAGVGLTAVAGLLALGRRARRRA